MRYMPFACVTIVGFVILLLAIVALSLFAAFGIFARVSGWRALAQRYPASAQPEGKRYTRQHVMVGVVRYRFSTTIIVSPQGLYLSTVPQHPPLLIPWEEIKKVESTIVYWRRVPLLSIGEPLVAKITLPPAVFAEARPYLNPAVVPPGR